MKRQDLPRYVYRITDRHGTTRRYFRRGSFNRQMPTGPTDADAFQIAYQKALADSYRPKGGDQARSALAYPEGTFGHLCDAYERSGLFRGFAITTRRELGYMIKRLVKVHWDKPVREIRRSHIYRWQDELSDRPGTANNMLRAMKMLMAFAVDREYRHDNPTFRMKELKGGSHRPWTADEHERFRACWPVGTMERRGYALGLYTGQRKTSVIKMTTASRHEGMIDVEPAKRGPALTICEHPSLTAELDAMTPPGEHLIWVRGGGKISSGHFGSMMHDAIHKALDETDADGNVTKPTDAVFHGLRKSAGKTLAEAGCSSQEIMAILGHATLRMAELYTKGAEQKRLAKSGMSKVRRFVRRAQK